jgi:hypothetical protein
MAFCVLDNSIAPSAVPSKSDTSHSQGSVNQPGSALTVGMSGDLGIACVGFFSGVKEGSQLEGGGGRGEVEEPFLDEDAGCASTVKSKMVLTFAAIAVRFHFVFLISRAKSKKEREAGRGKGRKLLEPESSSLSG